jgi:glycine cleavage system aminomethyltransferase T
MHVIGWFWELASWERMNISSSTRSTLIPGKMKGDNGGRGLEMEAVGNLQETEINSGVSSTGTDVLQLHWHRYSDTDEAGFIGRKAVAGARVQNSKRAQRRRVIREKVEQ